MSMMFDFDAKETVLVIGLGKSGLACVEVLRARNVTVYATDEKDRDELSDAICTVERQGARFVGPHEVKAVVGALSSTVLSPGVPPTSPVVRVVQDANVPVIGEIEVAYRDQGQVDHHRADRALVARRRFHGTRRR
jgi:UDP-N-acetylmuramoylalanine--D-glutamate ligase